MKFFYLHIPKTAGSFFNKFLSKQTTSFEDHIESKDISLYANKDIVTGHIQYPIAKQKNIIENRKVITILRNPIEQIISHITYVRELGEKENKEKLVKHNKTIQEIVKKLKNLDLSQEKNIEELIKWLEKNNISLFHDCQTRYLGGGGMEIKPINLYNAIQNLEKIDYVGTTERIKEFMILLNLKENFKLIEVTKENITKNRYGLDINKVEIRQALQPLIQSDHIVYREARKKFIHQIHNTLLDLEMRKWITYTTLKVDAIFKDLKNNNE